MNAHLKMFKKAVVSYANTVAEEYLVYSGYGDAQLESPFHLNKPRVDGNTLCLTASRPLAAKEIRAFERSFISHTPDAFGESVVDLDGVSAFLDLKKATLVK